MRLFYDLTAMPYLLVAIACGLVVALFAGALVLASIRRGRATSAFGDPALVSKLESFDAAGRRALKGVLLTIALVSAFLALARPQWGRGTKLVPATNPWKRSHHLRQRSHLTRCPTRPTELPPAAIAP